MSTTKWFGHAPAVKQAATCVVANTWAQNDTIVFTIDNITFTVTVGTLVTTAQVATTIKQAFNGETLTDTSAAVTFAIADGGAQYVQQFAEILASVNSSTVTFTGRTAGKPFTMTAVATTAGDGDVTYTNAVTAATGPNHISNVDNLSANAAVADNDTLVFDDGNIDVKYGLTLACQPVKIVKTKGYTGKVGLPAINKDSESDPYAEYRTPRYLTTDDNSVTTTCELEGGTGVGSGRFFWDAGAGQALLNIFGAGRREESSVPCVLFKGSHASNEVNNLAGDLGIAFYAGETATIPTLRTGDGPASSAKTYCSSGVTLTTVTVNGGTQFTDSAITTAVQNGGTWEHVSGTVTALTVNGGEFRPLGSATITTLSVGSGGTFDASKATDTFTITNTVQLYKGSRFIDPQGRAGNVVFKLNKCRFSDVEVVLAPDKTFTPS
jgi:hypothetical protein